MDKGIPFAGLLTHVMVAIFADHLPLYRQVKSISRCRADNRSLLAQWIGQIGVQFSR